jgi:uncharacterized protein YlxW (UPF0749 family)
MDDDQIKIELLKKMITALQEANNTLNQRVFSLENMVDNLKVQVLSIPTS